MANKHITNPCKMSGKLVPDETEIAHWRYPSASTIRVVCAECQQFVSMNRISKRYRKHNVGSPNWIVVPDTGFTCGNAMQVFANDQSNYVQSFE